MSPPKSFDLGGRAYIVTGAGGGIGSAVCEAMAAAGASVFAIDLEAATLARTAQALPGPQPHASAAADLADLAVHDELIGRAVAELGRLDGLVHLAALIRRTPIEAVTEAEWDEQLDLNLKASFFLNRAVARELRRGEGGAITNFTSQAWWSGGLNGSVVYAAGKAGLVAMSRGFARELAGESIRVNTIAPGLVDTRMIREDTSEEQLSRFVAEVPIGRIAEPDDIAGAAVFLASDAGSYITGATLNLTGGHLMY